MTTAGPLPSCEVLGACVTRHRVNRERLDAILDGVSEVEASAKPTPDAWSAVECLEHLRLTASLYRPPITAVIAKGRAKGTLGGAPYGNGTWIGRFILKAVDPDRPFKAVKAPGTFKPASSDLVLETVAGALREENAALQALAAQADGLDLGRLRVRTPITPLLRVSLDQAFCILSMHEARHLEQAARSVDAAGSGEA